MARDPYALAVAIETAAGMARGLTALDSASPLRTIGPEGAVWGVWVRPDPRGAVVVELDLIARPGAVLDQAGDEARAIVADLASKAGFVVDRIDARITELDDTPHAEPGGAVTEPATTSGTEPDAVLDLPRPGSERTPSLVEIPLGGRGRAVVTITVETERSTR